ncbi:MAG: hypothetical protein RI957_1545 [Verrucomicrobiota bacterium]|jgi:hypothetical protein
MAKLALKHKHLTQPWNADVPVGIPRANGAEQASLGHRPGKRDSPHL